MAGQTPEPSFQPAREDPGLTQGRPIPGWQQPPPPTYTPPGGSGGGQENTATSYAYGQAQAYGAPSYAPQDQGYGGAGQAYQDYQQAAYGAPAGQGQAAGTPQWQSGIAGAKPGSQPRQRGEKGFLGSLFDFSFKSFVTPKIIKVLYVLFTIWTALFALAILIIGFRTGGLAGGLFTLIVVEPIVVLLTLGVYRVVLEAFMVIFRIYEETQKIRENSETRSS